MNLRRDVRHGLRIGRAEFVRSVRQQVGSKRRLLGLAVTVLFLGGNLLFALPTAYVLGRAARSLTALPYLAPAATLLSVGLLLVSVFRTMERIGGTDNPDLLLTSVHPRAVVVGLLAAEMGRLAAWFGLPLAAFVVAFALGLGSLSLPVTVGLVAVPPVCWAAVWGYAAGLAALRVLRRLPGVHRLLKAGGVVAMLGLVVGSQFVGRYVAEADVSARDALDAFAFAPAAEYVALAFVGTPLERPASAGAAAVLVALVALTPVGVAVATRQASALWFADDPNRDRTSESASTGGFAAPRPFAWRKAGRIAWGHLVRGVRSPAEFGHLVTILFFVGPLGTTAVRSSADALGPLVAGVGVGLGTYLAGAAFGLNPIGDDRPQFPFLLLTPTPPRTVLRGRMVAGLALGLPPAVLVPLASTLLGTAPGYGIAFSAVGVGTCLAAAAFAVGVGSAYPIHEEREFWGTETVVPSTLVLVGYALVVGVGTAVGLVGTWYALAGRVTATPALGVGAGAYLLLTAGVSYGSYRYGLRRYRRYTLE